MTQSVLAVEKFWSEMRSTAYLWSKSSIPTEQQTRALLDQLGDTLGKRITTYPPALAELGIGADTSYRMKKIVLGLTKVYDNSDTTEADTRFMKFMANKAAQAAKANWCWRITQEAEQKQLDGWYPFFVTLTVDPKMTGRPIKFKDRTVEYANPADLWKQGREFRLYIRKLAKEAALVLGHLPPHKKGWKRNKDGVDVYYDYRPESDYVTYAGVIEHGKSQEHHHAHIMIWMKDIPSHWKVDPNQGRLPGYRYERECISLRRFWPWCIEDQKPALYFRTKGDIWSRLGHCIPTDGRKTEKSGSPNKNYGKPIKINPVGAVGNYVTKYMQKGTKVWNHRMKCTRNLGLAKIHRVINSIEMKDLVPLSWKPKTGSQLHSVSLIHSVPQGLLRSIARRRIFSIRWENRLLELTDLMKTNYGHYSRMLKSVRDGARPDRMHSLEFYDWVQKFLPEEKEYCETRMKNAHELLREKFPVPVIKVQPIVQGGNNIGFTQCI